jgi:hypothetical protein
MCIDTRLQINYLFLKLSVVRLDPRASYHDSIAIIIIFDNTFLGAHEATGAQQTSLETRSNFFYTQQYFQLIPVCAQDFFFSKLCTNLKFPRNPGRRTRNLPKPTFRVTPRGIYF